MESLLTQSFLSSSSSCLLLSISIDFQLRLRCGKVLGVLGVIILGLKNDDDHPEIFSFSSVKVRMIMITCYFKDDHFLVLIFIMGTSILPWEPLPFAFSCITMFISMLSSLRNSSHNWVWLTAVIAKIEGLVSSKSNHFNELSTFIITHQWPV
jgi:hypothetical protein